MDLRLISVLWFNGFIVNAVVSVRPEETLLRVLTEPLGFPGDKTSPECSRDGGLYAGALRNYTPWALQMYDASAKIPSGVITGNYKQLGNYDECLRVKSDYGFVGKACSAKVHFTISETAGRVNKTRDLSDLLESLALASDVKNWKSGATVPYEWLWCVPSSCDNQDVERALEMSLEPLLSGSRINLTVTVEPCHTIDIDRPVLVIADLIYISILVLFAIIVIVSTTYDLVKTTDAEKTDHNDTKRLLLTSFSLYTNGKSLLNTRNNGDNVACLDGLRYLSICWIIYGHGYYLQAVGVQLDVSSIPTMHEIWTNLLVLNGNIVTDTFFLLGGILLTYSELGRKEKQPHTYNLNVGLLYFHRYLRLTPAYAVVIGFYATLFYKMGSGPQWNTWVGSNRQFCVDNWWTNLLYINNYIDVGNMCMSQSWYLSVDMQLVWISPIFLYPLVVLGIKHIASVIVLSVGLFISIVAPLLITYFDRLTGTMLYYKEQTEVANVYLQIYTRVYARAGPYIVGLILGYVLHKFRNNAPKISHRYIVLGWVLAITVGLAVIFGPRGMYFDDYKYNGVEAAIYAGFHRTGFAVAVGWIVFTTVLGYAGPIGVLLSWSGWMPFGKLTYSAYLTHYIVLLYNNGSARTSGSLSTFGTVHVFLGNLGLTMLLSVILFLCFELPFTRMVRLFTRSRERRTFSKGSFNPTIDGFKSTSEIYRSSDDVVSTVFEGYDNIFVPYVRDPVVRIPNSIDSCDYLQSSPTEVPKRDRNSRRCDFY
ncbi:nose resistant to fluoxetine protein 6 [Fopius arisanus]|uniref:Nose resistant to fluoxetine protein 6 n=2 Tax=Fopius arisanus TaxID=64838 RepID=A0A0C9R472_9HYME|nr:PREDICTED: nose resistant to fluoxetine protein 6-like [Fopius arisanus]